MGVAYFELLKQNEIVRDSYRLLLKHLSRAIKDKRPLTIRDTEKQTYVYLVCLSCVYRFLMLVKKKTAGSNQRKIRLPKRH